MLRIATLWISSDKMIKPTMRMKRRYVGFRIIGEDAGKASENDIIFTFRSALLHLYGEVGSSESGFKLMEYDAKAKTGVARFERDFMMKGIAMFAFVKSINKSDKSQQQDSRPLNARPVSYAASGSIKRLKMKTK